MAMSRALGDLEAQQSAPQRMVSYCVTMCHYVSLCVTMCHYVSLCVTMCHYVSLCVTDTHT